MSSTYQYDMYATLSDNLISQEPVILKPLNGFNGQLALLNYGPFYINDFNIEYTVNGITTTLTEKKDYVFVFPFVQGILSVGMLLYTGVVVYNIPDNATINITYRTIGGDYVVDPVTLYHIVSDLINYAVSPLQDSLLFDLYNTSLDDVLEIVNQVSDVNCLPKPKYYTLSTDTTTSVDFVNEIESIATAINNRPPIPYTEFHINDFNNPHYVTKEQINLGDVPKLRLATDHEITIDQPLNVLFSLRQIILFIMSKNLFDFSDPNKVYNFDYLLINEYGLCAYR